MQTMLIPAGPQAGAITALWWLFLAVTTFVFVAVMIALVSALVAARRRDRLEPQAPPTVNDEPARERRATRWVGTSVGATALVLVALLIVDFLAGRAIHAGTTAAPLTIIITGHRWWWEVRYEDSV